MAAPKVKLSTNFGVIELELFDRDTPETVRNFLEYVDAGHYDGTIFHRVIAGFMIQGGGLDAQMNSKETKPSIQNEADKGGMNNRGTIAMARTGEPHSATCQFFINLVDNSFLNYQNKSPRGWGYCVFGQVVNGMDIVDKIAAVSTKSAGMYQDVPSEPVVIEKAERI